jgi:hypothetical protein
MEVALRKPIQVFDKTLNSIKLKEPMGGLYLKLGDPRLLVFNPSGSGYWIEQPEVIRTYLETLVDEEAPAAVLALLSIDDVMALKEALFGFFSSAAERRSGTKSTA